MNEVVSIVFSYQFIMIGLTVAFMIFLFFRIGSMLWSINNTAIRGFLRFTYAISPWVPPMIGAIVGAVPYWPAPEALSFLPEDRQYYAMIILGLFAGIFYERIWKGFRQVIKARGVDLNIDLIPKKQIEGDTNEPGDSST